MEITHELLDRVEILASEVADIGDRLERMECLLMCSDLSHVNKIDNLLKQLKKDVIEQTAETESQGSVKKHISFGNPLEADLQQPPSSCAGRTTSPACRLKVWPSYDVGQEEEVASTPNQEPEPENDFVPSCGERDSKTVPTCAQQSVEPELDLREPMANDMQAQPKQMATVVDQNKIEKCIEQSASRNPIRFWREDQGNGGGSETAAAADRWAAAQQHFAVDVKEPVANEKRAPRKQSRNRGWNLAAEAASSGKRIVPKKLCKQPVES